MSQTIEFELTWDGTGAATLYYLVHNNTAVPGAAGTVGAGKITLTYQVANAPIHLVAWGLSFLGEERKNLSCRVRIDGGEWKTLGTSSSSYHFWKLWGTL